MPFLAECSMMFEPPDLSPCWEHGWDYHHAPFFFPFHFFFPFFFFLINSPQNIAIVDFTLADSRVVKVVPASRCTPQSVVFKHCVCCVASQRSLSCSSASVELTTRTSWQILPSNPCQGSKPHICCSGVVQHTIVKEQRRSSCGALCKQPRGCSVALSLKASPTVTTSVAQVHPEGSSC